MTKIVLQLEINTQSEGRIARYCVDMLDIDVTNVIHQLHLIRFNAFGVLYVNTVNLKTKMSKG